MRRLICIAPLLLPAGLCAQPAKPGSPAQNLELNLEARDVVLGVPTTFRVILRNIGKEDIRLPEPSLGCASATNGTVWLLESVTPKPPGDALGYGCSGTPWPYDHDVLKRAKTWVLLRPGGYLERVASPGRMHYENHGVGTYDLSVEYIPPQLTPEEERALSGAAYVYPRVKLVSKHVLLKKP